MDSIKQGIYKNFWCIYKKDIKAAIIYLNKHSNGIAIPTFLKFRKRNLTNKGIVFINVQEFLKPKHIQSLINGWPDGHKDPLVLNIWFRLMREANITMKELPASPFTHMEATFTPVKFINETWDPITDSIISEEITAGYIVIDFSKF